MRREQSPIVNKLGLHEVRRHKNEQGRFTLVFLTTGDPELFRSLGERFLQLPLGRVERVSVAELEQAAA